MTSSPSSPASPAPAPPDAGAGASADRLERALHQLGYASFRPGQREAVETLLRERRLLLVAPTGGGKSLVYQLPAAALPGTTLVVSPLIALMHDQVRALEERGLAATFVASTLDAAEVRRRMGRMAAGDYKLVYVSPERITFPGFRALVRELAPPLVAIDEAHCISEWGHDFRPEYARIGELLGDVPDARVLACTATATPVVRDEILAKLGLDSTTPQIVRGFARPNLVLRTREAHGGRERQRAVDAQLAEALGRPGAGRGTAIVYAGTRKATEEEAVRLAGGGWRTRPYHAGLGADSRAETSRAFAAGELEVVVATNAFGMGIDRPDVRAVVHLAPPGSIEAYYQEVGRAGRDGTVAWGLLLFGPGDLPQRRNLLELPTEGRAPDPAIVEHKWGLFLELMRWAEGGSCRHDAILRYFGDEAETLDGCGRCDVCVALAGGGAGVPGAGDDEEERTLLVRKALSGVARVSGRLGLKAAIALLRGEHEPRLERMGLEATTTFGVLSGHSEEWLMALLRRCVVAGWVDFTGGERPVVVLTPAGVAVMKAEAPARLLLPPRGPRAGAAGGPGGRVAGGARAPRGAALVDQAPLDGSTAALFEALRRHRFAVSLREKVPPYVIASDRTLRDVALLRPQTIDQLVLAHGIGPAKAAKYGRGFLDVVRATPAAPAGGAAPPDGAGPA